MYDVNDMELLIRQYNCAIANGYIWQAKRIDVIIKHLERRR